MPIQTKFSEQSGIKPMSFGSSRKTVDLSDPQALIDYAATKGIEVKQNRPSFFKRTLDFLQRGNYMSANVVKDMVDGGEFKPLQSAWRGLSGQDKTTYSEVLDIAGMENKILRGGLGFVLDVALDPTTYFGGAIIKGAGKAVNAVATPIGKATQKAAPAFSGHIIDAANSLKDAFGTAFKFGYNVTPEVSNGVIKSLNRIGMVKEEIINKYVKVFEPLNKAQQKDFAKTLIDTRKKIRAYEEPRVAALVKEGKTTEEAISIARKEANEKFKPKFKDQAQQDVFEKGLKPEIDNLAELAGLDDAFKVDAYYPIMDIEKMNKADKTGRALAQSQKGYLREFKDKQKDVAKLLDKPIEAYSRVEMEAMRNAINKETLQSMVAGYGKTKQSFELLDDVAKLDYVAIKDKKMGGNIVGYLKKKDAEFINDYMFPEFKTIDLLAKASGYDKFTKIFKTAVTSWFPAFHVRNALSGVAQSYEVFGKEAFNPTNYMTAMGVMKKSKLPLVIKDYRGRVMFKGTGTEFKKIIDEHFGGASRYVSDLGQYIDDLGNGKFSFKRFKDPGKQLGNGIETFHKVAGTVMGLKQGKGMDEALKLAERAGFDYSKITKFEGKILRRMIPFYCVPDDSLAMTNNGWKSVYSLKKGDTLLTYNTDKKEYEWQPALEIATFNHDQELLSFSNKRHKLRFTDNHRWVVKTQGGRHLRLYGKKNYNYEPKEFILTGKELNNSHSIINVSEYRDNSKSLLTPSEARLLGWILTDGYYRFRKNCLEVVIYQSTKKFLSEVINIAGGTPRKPHPESGVVCVPVLQDRLKNIKPLLVGRNKIDNSWVDVVSKLSREAMEAMYEGMYMADGNLFNQKYFASQLNGVAETFELLATLLGKRVVRTGKGFTVSDNKTLKISSGKITKEYYNGIVWCPRTKNGTWVMKQGNLVTITGNTFMRKNAELQLSTLKYHPERILNQAKLASGLSEMLGGKVTEEDIKGLPDWVLGGLGFKISGDKYLSSFGLPIEEFIETVNRPLMKTLTSLNPIIKYPLESKLGYDFFREREIVDIKKIAPNTGEKLYEMDQKGYLPEWLSNSLNIKRRLYKGEYIYEASPKALHILRNLPTSRIQNTLEKIFDEDMDKVNKWTAFFSGAKVYDIDLETQAYFKQKDLEKDIQRQLLELGEGKQFKTFYIYK